MKKLLSILISLVMSISSLSMLACSNKASLYGSAQEVSYNIVIDQEIENGTLTASASNVVVGQSVTFTTVANAGYVLEGIYLNGSKVETTDTTYTVKYVLRNYVASAKFAEESVTVYFDGEGTSGLSGKTLAFGDAYGELPVPYALGKTFVCWVDEDGNSVTSIDKVSALDGDVVLTATYTDTPAALKEMHRPFTITTSYYDQAATKYGVAWHTRQEPIAPRLLLVEGDGSNGFDNAKVFEGGKFKWLTTDYGYEWIVDVVIDGLEFDTEYSVKFGDYCVDSWSDVYTFTTREEYPDSVKFFYVTDSQENQHVAYQNGVDTYMSQTLMDAFNRFSDVDMIVHGGDIVNDGGYPCRWEEMIASIDEYLFNYPTMVTAGNHEDPSSYTKLSNRHSVDVIFNIQNMCNDNKEVRGPVYSFDYGPMHFVCLRANDGLNESVKYSLAQSQINWLIEDVTKANQNPVTKWTVVLMHQGPIIPTFATLNSNSFTSVMGPQLIPVLDELDIDLLLYGHNHYLDSTYPLVWDNTITDVGVDNLKVKPVTKTIEKVTYDGVTVDKFVFDANTTDRGTVFHQTGTCGNQTNETFKYSELSANLALAKYSNYRMLLSGGAAATQSGKTLQMYSYIEVTDNSLVLRTYGVDVTTQIKEASFTGTNGYYMDGFMLTK